MHRAASCFRYRRPASFRSNYGQERSHAVEDPRPRPTRQTPPVRSEGLNISSNTPNRVTEAIEARLQESTATDLNLDAFLASLSLDDSGNLLTRTLRRAFAETEPEDPGDHAGTTTIGAYL